MTLRPPRPNSGKARETVLDYEIAQEQAAALGRLGRALEAALMALSRHDEEVGRDPGAEVATERSATIECGCCETPVRRFGALSSSGRPADCAIKGRSCATIAFPAKCKTAWALSAAELVAVRREAAAAAARTAVSILCSPSRGMLSSSAWRTP
jgi:hypothetical protein